MASFRAVLTAAIMGVTLGACSIVDGLSQYYKVGCPTDCDAGLEASGQDDAGDAAALPEGNPGNGDGGATDAGADADASSGNTPDASDGGPIGGDSGGCGSLSSVDNCGACGVACDKTTGTPSCTGATCTYACLPGHSDCNTTPPDTNGCECATPGCCGSSCQTSHADGVGQSYFDCNPPATYSESAALSACAAYAQSVGGTAADCIGPLTCQGSTAPTICFSSGGGTCADYCWQYSGKYADAGPGTVWDCTCPAHVQGSWN